MRTRYRVAFAIAVGLGLALIAGWYLHGHMVAVLQPAGTIARQERQLILIAVALSAVVVIPVFGLLFLFAWRYREGNRRAAYQPSLSGSRLAETIWWLVPSALILVISVITWQSSHRLDPFRPLSSQTKPLHVQVVALNWKWLFIYPDQHIATVNTLQLPTNTPIDFDITADAPMNSFWIPRLGGQMYAMPGMSTQLHLMADRQGTYNGRSANISGKGFAGMIFSTQVVSAADFNDWVASVHRTPDNLTSKRYKQLAAPSEHNPPGYYASVESGLYTTIMMQYMMPDATTTLARGGA